MKLDRKNSQIGRKPSSFQGTRRRRIWSKRYRNRYRNRFGDLRRNRFRNRNHQHHRNHRSTEGQTILGTIIKAIQTVFSRSIYVLGRVFPSIDTLQYQTI